MTYDGTPQYSAVQNMFNYSGTKTIQLHAGGDTYFNGGNVGIGTTSPDGILALSSDASVNPPTISDSRAFAQDVGGVISFVGKSDAGGGRSTFAQIKGGKENGTSGDYAGYFGILTRPNSGGSFLERIRITSAGSVGIGTTSPSYKLDVNGIINATDIYKNGVPFSGGGSSQWTTSGSDIFYNSGNVGIGDHSPVSLLTVGTSHAFQVNASGQVLTTGDINSQTSVASASGEFFARNTSGGAAVDVRAFGTAAGGTQFGVSQNNSACVVSYDSNTENFIVGTMGVTPLILGTSASERMRIAAAGNVGIGTTSPSYKLDVNGIINATDIYKNGVPFSDGGSGGTSSSASVDLAGGDFALSSASGWTDVTGMSITLIVGSSGKIQINFIGTVWNWDGSGYPSGTLADPWIGIKIDGGADAAYSVGFFTKSGAVQYLNYGFSTIISRLSVGSHTFQLRYFRDAPVTSTLVSPDGSGFLCRLSGFAL